MEADCLMISLRVGDAFYGLLVDGDATTHYGSDTWRCSVVAGNKHQTVAPTLKRRGVGVKMTNRHIMMPLNGQTVPQNNHPTNHTKEMWPKRKYLW